MDHNGKPIYMPLKHESVFEMTCPNGHEIIGQAKRDALSFDDDGKATMHGVFCETCGVRHESANIVLWGM